MTDGQDKKAQFETEALVHIDSLFGLALVACAPVDDPAEPGADPVPPRILFTSEGLERGLTEPVVSQEEVSGDQGEGGTAAVVAQDLEAAHRRVPALRVRVLADRHAVQLRAGRQHALQHAQLSIILKLVTKPIYRVY